MERMMERLARHHVGTCEGEFVGLRGTVRSS